MFKIQKKKNVNEGRKVEKFQLSQLSLSKLINKPTHISQIFNSCIDLISKNKQNLISDSGIHPSVHSNYNHQIFYGKFNLKVFYPVSHERHIWHYSMHMLL